MSGTIVCGVTGAPEARAAAQLASALASRLGLRLVLVHVATRAGDVEPGRLADELGGEIEVRVVPGEPSEELARVASEEGADVIVVGSRARRGSGRRLFCALAQELEALTDVPVLIAPPATRRRSSRRLAVAVAPPTR